MRADLLALNDDALVSLANRGLLKRSRKLIERGEGPTLSEEDEAVIGVFSDGVRTVLKPGVPLADTECSCPATGFCRHRIMVVLGYQAAGEASEAPDEEEEEAWDPGLIDDATIEALLGARALARARRALVRGLVVEVVRGSRPSCRLPATTVRFLVPNDVAYARCDCEAQTACEHVAHAVWAFREAAGVEGETVTIALSSREEVDLAPADAAVALADEVLRVGVIHLPETVAQRFESVRTGLQGARMVWPLGAVEDLEDMIGAYRSRSARYTADDAARALVELRARRDAARVDGDLPATSILGTAVASETKLDQLRLVSLGARVQGFERQRRCEAYMADPGSGTVLVVRREFEAEADEVLAGPDLARKTMTGHARFGALAEGQVVTQVARRRANRLLTIGAGKARTSVTPQLGDWSLLPEPIRVPDLAEFVLAWERRPPRLVRPRVLAENVHAFQVEGLHAQAWSPSRQVLSALIAVPGGTLTVELPWRGVTPGAVSVLSEALPKARWISGELRREARGFLLRPLALATPEGLVVPDLAAQGEVNAPLGGQASEGDVIDQAVARAWEVLVEVAHLGLEGLSASFPSRLERQAEALSEVGMRVTAQALSQVASATRALQGGQASPEAPALWTRAMLRLDLAAELAGG